MWKSCTSSCWNLPLENRIYRILLWNNVLSIMPRIPKFENPNVNQMGTFWEDKFFDPRKFLLVFNNASQNLCFTTKLVGSLSMHKNLEPGWRKHNLEFQKVHKFIQGISLYTLNHFVVRNTYCKAKKVAWVFL